MTLLDAKEFDPGQGRNFRNIIFVSVMLIMLVSWTLYHMRDYPERNTTDKFFGALQQKNFEGAYGIWFEDADWKKHPDKFKDYSYNDFYRDWGPGSEWGAVNKYEVDCSLSVGNGVIVQATVNNRLQPANVWVDKKDKTLSFPPSEIQCGNWWGWMME
ncbi:MAG TPA: hypothetical protein VGF44_14050 [Terriglobales bacterium]|jgi:hypothetical protein